MNHKDLTVKRYLGTPYEESFALKMDYFSSITDLVTYLKATPVNRFFQYASLESRHARPAWAGTNSYEEAEKLLSTGWSPAAEKLAQKVPVQTVVGAVKSSVMTYDVVGFQASVPRYLQGVPTNMVNKKLVPKKQKIITINKDMSYNCGWSSERILEEGIKALQIIQALEGAGFRVKLNMVFITSKNNEAIGISVCIKKPEERMSMIKVAFPMAHTSMLRRIGFDWVEKNQYANYSYTGSYGHPMGEVYKQVCTKGEYVLSHNIADIKKYVENVIKEQG